MALQTPPAVVEAFGDLIQTKGESAWFARDLSVDELRATVATINAATRASRSD